MPHAHTYTSKSDIETTWIYGCMKWIKERRKEGWTAYYVNFMFHSLQGTSKEVLEQMREAISRDFYSKFLLQFVRHPHDKSAIESMPALQLFPDLPVRKRKRKVTLTQLNMNCGGLHYNGIMLIPPVSRFRGRIVEHIEEHQGRYTKGNIERIHVVPIDHREYNIADYAAKTVKWGRADEADILTLPKAIAEVTDQVLVLSPEERAIKDIQSSSNVSDGMAGAIYRQRIKEKGSR
jgi:hypothetical protein